MLIVVFLCIHRKEHRMKYIVVDLEMNGIAKENKGKIPCKMEVIEIGAVMLDEKYSEVSSFRTYVKPEYNEVIEPKITALTGITTEMIDGAPTFVDAFEMFANWCLGTGDDFEIYAWSNSDFIQISKEIKGKGYVPDERIRSITGVVWTDLQKMVNKRIGMKQQLSLETAINMSGIELKGRMHDALDDARNTSVFLDALSNPEIYKNTLGKLEKMLNPERLTTSLGSMFDFSAMFAATNV